MRRPYSLAWGLLVMPLLSPAWAQDSSQDAYKDASTEASVRELRDEVHELRAAVEAMRVENARYREETRQMHQELDAVRHPDAVRAPVDRNFLGRQNSAPHGFGWARYTDHASADHDSADHDSMNHVQLTVSRTWGRFPEFVAKGKTT